MNESEAVILAAQIASEEDKVKEINSKIYIMRDRLFRECPHIVTHKEYHTIEGSYLNTGYNVTEIICDTCGKLLYTKKESTGNYE